ncbi:hypothetical protein, partial [Mycoplasmoides pirum]|uniref:hypothetical protein n=1 Tax=Mycoplasmoides pirum TaxID=2122 RepID=UPI00138B0FDA
NSFPVDSIQPGLSNNNQLSTPIIISISVATFVVLLAIILLVLWKNKVFSSKKNKLYLANYKNKKFDSSKLKSNAIVPISKKNNLYKTSNYSSLVTAKTKNISTIPLLTSKNSKSNLKTKELVPYKKYKGINSPIRTTNYSSKTKPLS